MASLPRKMKNNLSDYSKHTRDPSGKDIDDFTDEPEFQCDIQVQVVKNIFLDDSR